MNIDLSGKTALVTGSTAGIGYATALGLARMGAEATVNGRTRERVDHAVGKIENAVNGARIAGIAADLATAQGVAQVTEALPRVDILVNNLGIFRTQPFAEISDAEWQRFFDTNVMSGVRLTRHYLPGMLERDWGRVVFVSSESGINIPVEMPHYGFTKTAQLAISRGVAETTAGTNVTCNAVLPGPTRSEGVGDFVAKMAKDQGKDIEDVEREFFETARPSSLLKRFATPEEVANMICYVCSPASAATNGAALRVDGGVVRTIV
ncbi:MAG: SDR family NAD(P)-dependent oxidoreductase [Gammaproteobacteria bacterium]|nr:SDR family NAD(P)-dependent oxidoreductase [Gammaproteobacteria bacterium]